MVCKGGILKDKYLRLTDVRDVDRIGALFYSVVFFWSYR